MLDRARLAARARRATRRRRAAARAGRREGAGALRRAAAARPHWHDAGKWPDAITALEAYFAHRPAALATEDARHRIDLADAYLRLRQPQKALALFERGARATRKATDAARADRRRVGDRGDRLQARRAPLLRELEPIAEQHPEVWLVDGQCALALGDAAGALALGRRYLDRGAEGQRRGPRARRRGAGRARQPRRGAQGARDRARARAGSAGGWTVRLATCCAARTSSRDALAALDKLGPPATPAIDPDWWVELGEALLAQGDAAGAVDAARAGRRRARRTTRRSATVLGAAQLAAGPGRGRGQDARRGRGDRSRRRARKKLLVDALTTVARRASSPANDAAAAEPLLARADQLDGNALVWRDLGIARLALDKPADAIAGARSRGEGRPVADHADARRARARARRATSPARGRSTSARSPRDKDNAIEIALDWAASELAGGDPAIAVTALEKTAAAAKTGPLAARHTAALATARHAAGARAAARRQRREGGRAAARAAVAGEPTLATQVRSRGRRGRRRRCRAPRSPRCGRSPARAVRSRRRPTPRRRRS